MDILPQYIAYMVFAPVVIWLCLRGQWLGVAIGSLLVWLAAQLGLHRILTFPVDAWLAGAPDQEGLRVSFNLLGWQIVFFSGIIAGTLTSMKKIEWQKVFDPNRTTLAGRRSPSRCSSCRCGWPRPTASCRASFWRNSA